MPFIGNVRNRQIYKDRKISGYLGLQGRGREPGGEEVE